MQIKISEGMFDLFIPQQKECIQEIVDKQIYIANKIRENKV